MKTIVGLLSYYISHNNYVRTYTRLCKIVYMCLYAATIAAAW